MQWGVVFVAVATGACTLFTPFGTDLTSGNPGGDDAGSPALAVDAGGGGGGDADVGGGDAQVDAGPCDPTKRTLPFRAFDATPVGASGELCGMANVLVEDGQVAGLDRTGPNEPDLAGKGVTSCIGVELPHALATITARVQPTPKACNVACGSLCGTGRTFYIFAGPNAAALEYLPSEVVITSGELTDYTKVVPDGLEARVVVVCRTAWGTDRDDIAVDAIHGKCR